MSKQRASRVLAGMNDYRFVASLQIKHPTIEPSEITDALKLVPKTAKTRGDRRRRPVGGLQAGNYEDNYWTAELEIIDGHDIADFLLNLIDRQGESALEFTRRIYASGGSTSIFIGIFARSLCDFEIPACTLSKLGDAGIAVRLDYYGPERE